MDIWNWVITSREGKDDKKYRKVIYIFFYAGAGEKVSCQFFTASSERIAIVSIQEYSENFGKCIYIILAAHMGI